MTTYIFDGDIDTMLADSPHSMTVSAVKKKVWYDEYEEEKLSMDGRPGQVIMIRKAQFKTNDFPDLKIGDAVTIDSTDMKIIGRQRLHDGAVTEIYLGQ